MAFATDSRANASPGKTWHPFVVLLVGHAELRTRSFETLLESTGYAVLHADSGFGAIELATSVRADAVIVGERSPDMTGVELCRRLTGNSKFSPSTPVIVATDGESARTDRLEAYSAGAWSVCPEPVDDAILLLKLQTFIRARHVGERLREGSFYDGATGLYNLEGLLLRAREMGSAAGRRREPLACVAFAPDRVTESGAHLGPFDNTTIDTIAETCRRSVRGSDALGRIGAVEFAIVAPSTNEVGARGLLGRLQHSLRGANPTRGALPVQAFRASICATSDVREAVFGAVEMLMQAVSTLRLPV